MSYTVQSMVALDYATESFDQRYTCSRSCAFWNPRRTAAAPCARRFACCGQAPPWSPVFWLTATARVVGVPPDDGLPERLAMAAQAADQQAVLALAATWQRLQPGGVAGPRTVYVLDAQARSDRTAWPGWLHDRRCRVGCPSRARPSLFASVDALEAAPFHGRLYLVCQKPASAAS